MTLGTDTIALLRHGVDALLHLTGPVLYGRLSPDERRSALMQLMVTAETAARIAEVGWAPPNKLGGDAEYISAETERLKAEAGKVEKETERAARETERLKAEADKVRAETEKVGKEIEKVVKQIELTARETFRLKVEGETVEKEAVRAAKETERIKAEAGEVGKEVEGLVAGRESMEPEQAKVAKGKEAEQAKVAKEKEAEQAKVAKEKEAEQAKVAKEKEAEQAKVAKEKEAEQAKVAKEKEAEQAKVPKEKEAEQAKVAEEETVDRRLKLSSVGPEVEGLEKGIQRSIQETTRLRAWLDQVRNEQLTNHSDIRRLRGELETKQFGLYSVGSVKGIEEDIERMEMSLGYLVSDGEAMKAEEIEVDQNLQWSVKETGRLQGELDRLSTAFVLLRSL